MCARQRQYRKAFGIDIEYGWFTDDSHVWLGFQLGLNLYNRIRQKNVDLVDNSLQIQFIWPNVLIQPRNRDCDPKRMTSSFGWTLPNCDLIDESCQSAHEINKQRARLRIRFRLKTLNETVHYDLRQKYIWVNSELPKGIGDPKKEH